MIRVTVELLPFGSEFNDYGESQIKKLAEVSIVNDMSHPDHPAFGNYKIKSQTHFMRGTFLNEGKVLDHNRELDVLLLVQKAIEGLGK